MAKRTVGGGGGGSSRPEGGFNFLSVSLTLLYLFNLGPQLRVLLFSQSVDFKIQCTVSLSDSYRFPDIKAIYLL